MWLVILAFFISRGVTKTGIGRGVALLFMGVLGRRTIGLGYGLALTELVISPAMPSITARAGGVMLPITRAISGVLGSEPDEEMRGKVGCYLILCAFRANVIAAGMFVTAMAGNPLAVKLAADQGVKISWLDWALAAFGSGVVCLALIPLVLLWLAPPRITQTPDAPALAHRELSAMGAITHDEITMATIFLGLLVLWVFGDTLGIGATLAAALGVSLMFAIRVLTWQDALNEKSAWDTMIWIGLLIMPASKLNEYGTVNWFGKGIGTYLGGFPPFAVFALVSIICVYIYLCPLLLRQCDRAYQRTIPAIAGVDDRGGCAGLSLSPRARLSEQRLWVPDSVRNRFWSGDVWSKLCDPGRVVESRVRDERDLYFSLSHRWSTVGSCLDTCRPRAPKTTDQSAVGISACSLPRDKVARQQPCKQCSVP